MIRVFTAFSGYDSQCMALERAGIEYDLVGWSEIDKYAILAHDAVFPQFKGRNYGDITKIDWNSVPDFDLFTYSSPCQDFSKAGRMRGGRRIAGLAHPYFGCAGRQSGSRDRNTASLRMWKTLSPKSSTLFSANGNRHSHQWDTTTIGRLSTHWNAECLKTGNEFFWFPSLTKTNTLNSPSRRVRCKTLTISLRMMRMLMRNTLYQEKKSS